MNAQEPLNKKRCERDCVSTDEEDRPMRRGTLDRQAGSTKGYATGTENAPIRAHRSSTKLAADYSFSLPIREVSEHRGQEETPRPDEIPECTLPPHPAKLWLPEIVLFFDHHDPR